MRKVRDVLVLVVALLVALWPTWTALALWNFTAPQDGWQKMAFVGGAILLGGGVQVVMLVFLGVLLAAVLADWRDHRRG